MELDVFVVNYNTKSLLSPMFEACDSASNGLSVRYFVVDNASVDGSVEYLVESFPNIHLETNSKNIGFGRANNQLLSKAGADYVLLLNTDAFVSRDTFNRTLAFMCENERCGILGVKLVDSDGELQPSCRYFPSPWNTFLARTGLSRIFPKSKLVDDMTWDHSSVRECDWVPGCYYLVRRKLIDQIGLFDSRFFLYFEEVDHCKRAKEAGWKVMFYPHTSVVHIGGESAKSSGLLSDYGKQLSPLQIESEILYFRKHFGVLGLLLHCVLVTFGDIYLAIKDVVKQRGHLSVVGRVRHLSCFWRSCQYTRGGTQPTR